jgi:hypothetical protein
MIYLIGKSDFSPRCDVSDFIEEKYLLPHILKAQEQFLKPVLGTDFYESLLTQVSSTYFITPEDQELYEQYVKTYLVYRAYSLYLPYSPAFMTGYGPVQMTENNSEKITDKRLSIMTDEARNSAQYWQGEMIRYICDNISSFASYENSEDRNTKQQGPKITGIKTESRKRRTISGKKRYYSNWNND